MKFSNTLLNCPHCKEEFFVEVEVNMGLMEALAFTTYSTECPLCNARMNFVVSIVADATIYEGPDGITEKMKSRPLSKEKPITGYTK
jgi:hypothetical protein